MTTIVLPNQPPNELWEFSKCLNFRIKYYFNKIMHFVLTHHYIPFFPLFINQVLTLIVMLNIKISDWIVVLSCQIYYNTDITLFFFNFIHTIFKLLTAKVYVSLQKTGIKCTLATGKISWSPYMVICQLKELFPMILTPWELANNHTGIWVLESFPCEHSTLNCP